MSRDRLSVVVTRRLPDVVEARLQELFDVTLRSDDQPMSRDELAAAVRTADILVPTLTDRIDQGLLAQAGDKLKLIAAELVNEVRNSVSVDWWKFEQRRNKIRVAIKRLLRKHGYPPDLQESAVKVVVMQAEAISAEISVANR